MGASNAGVPVAEAATAISIEALVGARIAEARRKAGLTVRDLAATLKMPHTTLNNYETGRRPIPLDRLAQIAGALRRPPASFLVESAEEADLIASFAGSVEKCLQVKLVLAALDEEGP
jgi:transcriptional regulator with XRE-family HTH domain